MLGKVMKYDFKTIFKTMVPMYAILLGIAVLNRILLGIAKEVPILSIVNTMLLVVFVFLLIAVPAATFAISVIHFYKNMTRDEGYLTHTLPVKKTTLVVSKLLTSGIAFLVSICISLLAVLVVYYTKENMQYVLNLAKEIFAIAGNATMILGICMCVMSYISQILMAYFAIAIGQMQNTNKLLFSVVAWFVLYTINQIIVLALLVIASIANPSVMEAIMQNIAPVDSMPFFIGIAIAFSTVMSIIYFIATSKIMKKRLNLE